MLPRQPPASSPSVCPKHSCAATSAGFPRTSDSSARRPNLLKFGVIAEGPTDQVVIENILVGYFGEDNIVVNPVEPPRPLDETPGGWGRVIKCLERDDHEGFLQYNDYLVIHIDADTQDDYGVPS